ncbi:MAG: hypothetical protein E7465_06765 [Ruminococcaceae bacterium]|nr:hypothetical protein [Oscillospiraceae bacterium]
MKGRKATCISAALGMLVLILDSKNSIAAASQGVDICIRTVIPSLFPFFVLSILLTGSMGSTSVLVPLEKLFRARGCGPILITGLLGGYPVGAQAAAQGYSSDQLSRAHAHRLIMFCSQAGPSFLFGMAASQFPEGKYAWLLWLVQILSALCVARMIPAPESDNITMAQASSITLSQAMRKAVSAMASVCGWVVLFRVILDFLQRYVFFPFPKSITILLSGLLELTNGCLLLSEIPSVALRFLWAALMLNFGGICVMMQTSSVIEGLKLKYYIQGKLLQTLFSLLISLAFLGYYAALMPVLILLFLPSRRILRKNSSIPAAFGV